VFVDRDDVDGGRGQMVRHRARRLRPPVFGGYHKQTALRPLKAGLLQTGVPRGLYETATRFVGKLKRVWLESILIQLDGAFSKFQRFLLA
jgi:hypothetical protein